MPNTLTARNMELTPTIRDYVEKKVDRLRKVFDNIQKIDVILSSDKLKRGEADLIVQATQGILKCAAKDETAMAAFDIAMEKMERQLQRHKAKIVGNKKHLRENPRRREEVEGVAELPAVASGNGDEDLPVAQTLTPEALTPHEALSRFVRSNYDVLVYRDTDSQNISILFRDQEGENRLLEVSS